MKHKVNNQQNSKCVACRETQNNGLFYKMVFT